MLIRDEIISLLEQALESAKHADAISSVPNHNITVEHPNRHEHGNFSSNLPLKIQGLALFQIPNSSLDLSKQGLIEGAIATSFECSKKLQS